MMVVKVAVIGAGLGGLSFCKTLLKRGNANLFQITVFEKSRGPGGRISTRREKINSSSFSFDHGAQYFTARDPIFEEEVNNMINEGVVKEWKGTVSVVDINQGLLPPNNDKPTVRFVGNEGMNSVGKFLAQGLTIKTETRVTKLTKEGSNESPQWLLESEKGEQLGLFDVVVINAPSPQAITLLEASPSTQSSKLIESISQASFRPCWCIMAGFDAPLQFPFDGAFVHNSPISWIARNNSKPGRPEGESWTIHAAWEWSQQNLEKTESEISQILFKSFEEVAAKILSNSNSNNQDSTQSSLPSPVTLKAHRWRFAIPEPIQQKFLFDNGIGVCGDWCGGPRVEGAYMSGYHLAEHVLATKKLSAL